MTDNQRRRYGSIPNVEPIGFVESLENAYANAALSVVPVYNGSGTNIKVAEALSYGRVVVGTEFAWRGYSLIFGDNDKLCCAGNDKAFAEACVKILRDCALRQGLETRGRRFVEKFLSFDNFSRIVHDSVQERLFA